MLLTTSEIKIKGEALTELPHDLYIPPDALEVYLEAFEGPLDLLLYLIRKHNLDMPAIIGMALIIAGAVIINVFSKSVVH